MEFYIQSDAVTALVKVENQRASESVHANKQAINAYPVIHEAKNIVKI